MSVEEVPDPVLRHPTDAVIEVSTTNICGSDLHLCEVLGAFMDAGDVLGHEPMGRVVEVGDRVVIPFQISCGHCYMCGQGLQTQCETTQVREQGMGAALCTSPTCCPPPGRRWSTRGSRTPAASWYWGSGLSATCARYRHDRSAGGHRRR
ncbi:hypothetical protein GCM10023353_18060 [Tomitella cavernea]|uniref:Alcohol dehydrogenase-like N-terminal domain-containing protein n=1 Tax=Tomitella cavernea TaxID=1387982 RepID=A0ABP9CP23_9ACTN